MLLPIAIGAGSALAGSVASRLGNKLMDKFGLEKGGTVGSHKKVLKRLNNATVKKTGLHKVDKGSLVIPKPISDKIKKIAKQKPKPMSKKRKGLSKGEVATKGGKVVLHKGEIVIKSTKGKPRPIKNPYRSGK